MSDTPPDPEILHAVGRALARLGAAIEERVPEDGRIEPLVLEVPFETARLRGLVLRFETTGAEISETGRGRFWVDYQVRSGSGGSVGSYLSSPTRASFLQDVVRDGTRTERLARLVEEASRRVWRSPAEPVPDRMARISAGGHAAPPAGPDCRRFRPGVSWWGEARFETLHEDDRFDRHRLQLIHCNHCGQVFVHRFSNAWTFQVRVSEAEAALVREDYGWADALIQSRRHLTRRPPGWGGKESWATGPEPELSR
jgi:hypothetical protein